MHGVTPPLFQLPREVPERSDSQNVDRFCNLGAADRLVTG